jgi:Flp pilus assembly protein TadG
LFKSYVKFQPQAVDMIDIRRTGFASVRGAKAMLRKFRSNQGQTVVEFAFVLVPLLILVLGIMEFGMILYDKAVLTDACREAARQGIMFRADATKFEYTPLTEAQIKTVVGNYVQDRLVNFGEPFDPTTDVAVAWDPAPTHGSTLEVAVNFPYTFLALPKLGDMGSSLLNLSARSTMRME